MPQQKNDSQTLDSLTLTTQEYPQLSDKPKHKLDTNYENRSLFPVQAFFPMANKKDGGYKLRRDTWNEPDKSQLDKFHGTVFLPFEAGDHKRIASKIVDDFSIESLKVMELNE